MIQAVGLTSEARRGLPPAVDDLTFEAPAGAVTVLLGARGAGKTTALRLMLRLERGRGITLFRGRPLHRLPNPARELGVLLGDVPGHPARTARSHLRMLTAAAGVSPDRAEDVLEAVGLGGLAEQRLGEFSRGMDRRLGMAAALLGDPHTLLLDEPDDGLSPRERAWLYGLLRGFAERGGSVLVTASDPKAAARLGDRVVTIEDGRLLAEQETGDFTHARLRPRVSVRSPHADRLAALLVDEWQRADPAVDPRAEQPLEVVRESGNRLAVYGSSCALVGDTAFRHGILVHQLADETGDARPAVPLNRADGRAAARLTAGQGAMVAAEPAKAEADTEKDDARYAVAARGERDEPHAAAGDEARAEAHAGEERTHAGELVRKDAGGHCAVISGSVVMGSTDGADGLPASGRTATAPSSPRPLSLTKDPDGTIASTLELATAPAAPGDSGAPAVGPTGTPPHGTAVPLAAPRAPRTSPSPRGKVPAAQLMLPRLSAPGPAWPVRYELRRAASDRTGIVVGILVLAISFVLTWVLARTGGAPADRVLMGWPDRLPFPPAAVGAGLIGALAFGQEFRYPALAPEQGSVPRRVRLLAAKLLVSAASAAVLALASLVIDGVLVGYVFGVQALPAVADWPLLSFGWGALLIGSAWTGLLAAGLFRSTAMGLATLLAVPVAVVPLIQGLLSDPAARSMVGFPARVRTTAAVEWPSGVDRLTDAAWRLATHPVAGALTLSLAALLCAYTLTALNRRAR
ncbi:ATP-binding cassette domain-containing protein [Streptomyces purpurogeneiscleroticus]|uniref:ATP-binding cassette domain-containing protein n=1 Tax=Streptomyces purpurogeneiscleroticus TaxID=68259 RepID=UPI001CBD55A3|nr:ATP-binding cassette domain-containing protein [Streptomyces purpurogeneiscleroticus]MBZ4017539.1 ABC transporter [Streptomyces purpurogeneiscleroticus]